MTPGFLLAIATGVLYGFQGVVAKWLTLKSPPLFAAWVNFTFTLPFLLLLLWVDGMPLVNWPSFSGYTLVSLLVNLLAWYLFFEALATSPLYLTMPFTALTPLFTLPIAYGLMGELPGSAAIAGILLIIVGAYGIYVRRDGLLAPFRHLFATRGTRLMMMVALLWSVSATVEKVAVLNSSPAFYAVVLHCALILCYLPLVMVRHRPAFHQTLRRLPAYLVMGMVSGSMIICQFYALTFLDVSIVIAFKRAGVVISVLAGAWLFREKHLARNMIAVVLIVFGALLIIL